MGLYTVISVGTFLNVLDSSLKPLARLFGKCSNDIGMNILSINGLSVYCLDPEVGYVGFLFVFVFFN